MRSKFAILAAAGVAIVASGALPASAQSTGSISVLGRSPGAQCADHAAETVAKGIGTLQGVIDCTQALTTDSLTRADRAATYLNRGVIEEAMAKHDAALGDFNTAMQMNPAMAEAYLNRGVLYATQHRSADAVADFSKAIDLNPAQPALVYFNRAIAYEDEGNAKAAYLDYQKASRLAPDWAEPKQQLARFTVVRRQAQG